MHCVLFKKLIMCLYNLLLKMKSQEAINFEDKVCVWRLHFQLFLKKHAYMYNISI